MVDIKKLETMALEDSQRWETVVNKLMARASADLEDHETRIKRLEQFSGLASLFKRMEILEGLFHAKPESTE